MERRPFPTSTRRLFARPIALTVCAILALAACGLHGSGDGPTAPAVPVASSSAPDDGSPATDAPSPTSTPTTVSAGDVTLEITAPTSTTPVPATPGEDASQTVTLHLGAQPATITLLSGGTFVRNADRSVTVTDGDRAALGGFSHPRLGTSAEPPLNDRGQTMGRVTVDLLDPTHLEVGVVPIRATAPGSGWDITTWLGADALRTATWGEQEGGRSLAVDPTAWARTAGRAGQDTAWSQLIHAEPEADSPTMHDQLNCHAIAASDKPTWNLEPWRPDVGFIGTSVAHCNPT